MQSGDACFDGFSTPGALPLAVTLDPVVLKRLRALLAFHVGGDAACGGSMDAPLVHGKLANWKIATNI